MSNKGAPFHGVMEGEGAYNRYAKLPAGGGALALPLLEKAVRCVELDTGDQPVVIADLWIVSGEKLDGPHTGRDPRAATPAGSKSRNLCVPRRPAVERFQRVVRSSGR